VCGSSSHVRSVSARVCRFSVISDSVASGRFDVRSTTSVSFCVTCGGILADDGTSSKVKCKFCGRETPVNELMEKESFTRTRMEDKWKVGLTKNDEVESRATVREVCAKCGHNEAYYRTAQLRSADEGQTIFYQCIKCGHKHAVNT